MAARVAVGCEAYRGSRGVRRGGGAEAYSGGQRCYLGGGRRSGGRHRHLAHGAVTEADACGVEGKKGWAERAAAKGSIGGGGETHLNIGLLVSGFAPLNALAYLHMCI